MKFLTTSLIVFSSGLLFAQQAETAVSVSPDQSDAIPLAYRGDRYQATWDKNPFLIKVAQKPPGLSTFAQDWELKYLNERNGVTKAGIQNRKTQEFRNIMAKPDSEGFQLVKATISRQRSASMAEIGNGIETAVLKYGPIEAPPPSPQAQPAKGGIRRSIALPRNPVQTRSRAIGNAPSSAPR